MNVKKIYLIRHGQTEYNKLGIVQGAGVDASLNDTGKAQAKAFYDKYKDHPFDIVYTSALTRSIESVQGFIDKTAIWEKRAELNEISWGDYDGVKITEGDYYWSVVNAWKEGKVDLSIKNGESPVDVRKRLTPFWDEILASDKQNILICMHGRAMRILLCTIFDQHLIEMDNYEHHNLGLYIIEINSDGMKLNIRNDISHLSGIQ